MLRLLPNNINYSALIPDRFGLKRHTLILVIIRLNVINIIALYSLYEL